MLVTLSGANNINLLSAMGELADKYSASLNDIQQTRTSTRITLHVLLGINVADDVSGNDYHRFFSGLTAAIKTYADEHSCIVHMDSVLPSEVTRSAVAESRVLLLAKKLTVKDIGAVVAAAESHGLTFETVQWLSGCVEPPAGEGTESIEADQLGGTAVNVVELLSSSVLENLSPVRDALLALSDSLKVDIFIQSNTYDSRHRRLVCFDMDSTLIDAEVIDELAKEAGVGEQVSAITESAMRGDIAFNESFRQRMALLEGLDEKVLASVAQRLRLNDGVEKLLLNLHKRGYKTAILSGGFDYFGRFLQKKLGIDYVYANTLDIVDGKVTGKVTGIIVNGDRKAELLQELAKKEGLSLSQVVAVGDGANDLPMLSLAGMGVAFRAKPRVKAAAEFNVTYLGLDSILYLMGFARSDIIAR
jgi:phosphoserine phosphatase